MFSSRSLFEKPSEKVNQDGKNDTEDNAGDYGKIEFEMFLFQGDIAWKLSQVEIFAAEMPEHTKCGQY